MKLMRVIAPVIGPMIGLAALIGANAAAQNVSERVAAVVNDYPISTFDVSQRLRLMVITQGAQIPEEAIPQFQQQALRDLVEERLKLQEADRFELVISDDEINRELARIAAGGGADLASLEADLARSGIAIGTLREKIRAEQAWEQLVQGRYGSRVNVTDNEVEDMIDQLRSDAQQEQMLLSEICLPLGDPSERERMYSVGLQMIDQMRQGVPFRALAQQYSACPTAARGGDIGWMKSSDLDPDIAELVAQLVPGSISRPVPQGDMLKMIAVRQRREATAAGEPGYAVAYAGAPVSIGEEAARAAFDKLTLANPCVGARLSADLGPEVGVTILPMMKERAYQTVFHDVLAGLEEGQTSDVIESDGAYHAVLLCEKDEGLGLPPRRQVENSLQASELDLISRRYLRDVERDSAVEIRLGLDG